MNDWKKERQQYSRNWKEKNVKYIKRLQQFFDVAENIPDEQLKKDVICKMLKCDETLTKIAEKYFMNLKQHKGIKYTYYDNTNNKKDIEKNVYNFLK